MNILSIHEHLQNMIQQARPWLQQWGLLTVAGGLFFETFMFTGFWFPGFTILIAAGYLIAAGDMSLLPVALVAIFSAIAGDLASYWLGATFGTKLLRKKAARVMQIRIGLEKDATFLLLTYHYAPPLRALLPCAAGFSGFNFRRWIVVDSIGVAIWILLLLTVGYMAHRTLVLGSELILQSLNAVATICILYGFYRFYKVSKTSSKPSAENEIETK